MSADDGGMGTRAGDPARRVLPAAAASLALVALVVIVFGRVWQFEFVNLDDPCHVQENPHVAAGLAGLSPRWAFLSSHCGNWFPLTWLSHALDVSLYGLNAGWHHVTNLGLHAFNTVLLLFVLRRLTGTLWRPALVAALFAIHPLHVESVAWVAERKDVLSTAFWMLTIWSYAAYVAKPRAATYGATLLWFSCGLMAKPMVITLPFVLLLLDFWPLGRLQRRAGAVGMAAVRPLLVEKIPFFVLSATAALVTYLVQSRGGFLASPLEFPLHVRLANAPVAVGWYLAKTIWPSRLACLYPHPGLPPWWQTVLCVAILAALTAGAAALVRKRPAVAVGWLWFLGTLMPVIGLVQVGPQAMADRYTYIPLVGVFIAFAWGIPWERLRRRQLRVCAASVLAVWLSVLSVLCFRQVGHWRNSVTLFQHALDLTSGNYILHTYLAASLIALGRYAEAFEHCRAALEISPGYAEAFYTWGYGYSAQRDYRRAIAYYEHALQLQPDHAEVHNNLGVAYAQTGDFAASIRHLLRAVELNPDSALAKANLALLGVTPPTP